MSVSVAIVDKRIGKNNLIGIRMVKTT